MTVTVDCRGGCEPKKRGGYKTYGGDSNSCLHVDRICDYCPFSDRKMPGKYRCSKIADCKTGNCECQYRTGGIVCAGCQGYCNREYGDVDL